MKTIIFPTDFSENAANALHFAAALAAQNKSKLLLVHAIPGETVITLEGSEVFLQPDPRLEVYFLNQLVVLGKQIRLDTGYDFEMEAICPTGALLDTLNRLVRSKQADLVVMGTKGAHKLTETLLGTNSFHFMRQAVCPVLVIPEKAPFREIKRIAYASDFEIEDESVYLRQLLSFAAPFCPQIYIINIQSDEQLTVVSDQKVLRNIETQFPDHPFCIAQIREDDVVKALEDFVSENKIDILAIGIQKRVFLDQLFHRSVSRQLAFHFPGPLLALPPYPHRVPVEEEQDGYSLSEPH